MVRFSHFEYTEKHWGPLDEVSFRLPSLQAHRGYWVEGQGQNTVGALQAAVDHKFRMAEVDLRLTRDRVPVLFHDPIVFDVDQARKIRDLTVAEIKGLLPVSTLEEALEKTPQNFYLNLEIKNESKTDFSLEEFLIQSLKGSVHQSRILFSSFNPFSLGWMARLVPDVPRALLVSQERAEWNSLFLRELTFLRLARPHFLNVRWEDLDHYRDIPHERLVVWTLNSASHAKSLVERAKVISVISDSIRPEELEETP